MRLRCRIADDAPIDLVAIRLAIEVGGQRLGVPFARETGLRERKGPGCVVDLSEEEALALQLAVSRHELGAHLVIEPLPAEPSGPVLRLTIPGEYQDRDIVEVPVVEDAPGASPEQMRATDRAIERRLPGLVRQAAAACGGLRRLPPFKTAEERAAVARRAPPPGVEHPLVGRARVLEEAARQIREKAATELQAAAIARAELEASKQGSPAPAEAAVAHALMATTATPART